MSSHSPSVYELPSGGFISTAYIFNTISFQAAANSVYVQKSTFDGDPANAGRMKFYTFKSQGERMQYLIGQQGSAVRFFS